MGLLRQAYVQRSYGMVPLCCSKAPLPTFSLVNNYSPPPRLQKHKITHTYTYTYTGNWPAAQYFFQELIREKKQMSPFWCKMKNNLLLTETK